VVVPPAVVVEPPVVLVEPALEGPALMGSALSLQAVTTPLTLTNSALVITSPTGNLLQAIVCSPPKKL
jgi:hypothetical protein